MGDKGHRMKRNAANDTREKLLLGEMYQDALRCGREEGKSLLKPFSADLNCRPSPTTTLKSSS